MKTPTGIVASTAIPTIAASAVAGIGSKLLAGSYYSQTIDVWAALIAGSVVAVILVTVVDIAARLTARGMGARPQ